MKTDAKNKPQPNTNPEIAKDSSSRNPSNGSAAQQKKGRKRSRKSTTLPVSISVWSIGEDNLLCIHDGKDNWILESEFIRVLGPASSKVRKSNIPKFCFSNLVVPKQGGGKAKLEALSMTRFDEFNNLACRSIQTDRDARRN